VKVAEEPRGLTREALAGYDAVLLNYNGPRWGAGAEAALEDFVRSGKGLVSFHGVTYGPLMGTTQRPGGGWTRTQAWPAYPDMLGASWAPENIGHAPRGAFVVKLRGESPITRGMAAEFTVNDELYHKLDLRPGDAVVATAFDDKARGGTGKDEPLAWTSSFGKGRTFHCALGHDVNALYQPEVATLLARAAEWAATGEVTLPPQVSLAPVAKNPVRVLVATGGHGYDPSFYSVFNAYPDLRWSHAVSQRDAFKPGMADRFDVLVVYDLANELGEAERQNLRAFVDAGKGVVALHHSIVDYTDWPWWWQEVIGGKYFEKPLGEHAASHYKEGVPVHAKIVPGKENHPVVRGLGDLVTVDECYNGMWHSPKITVLMESTSACNDKPLVYLGPHPKVVYIQLGHDTFTHEHPGYRQLVHNAILWAASRE
jgi:type 1 glutamine amidotransferase